MRALEDELARLRESEAQHRLIIEGARDYAIITMGRDGRVTSWSPGAEAVFGWRAAEIVGEPVDVTFAPEDRAAGVPEAERAEAAARDVAPDVRWHRRRDGQRVFIDGSTRALRDEAGAVRGFIKIGQDVTRRRELDDALRASEARYRTLVDNVHEYAIYLLDPEGRITEWPVGAERLLGYEPGEVMGLHFSLLFTDEARAAGEPDRELAEAAALGRAEREGWRVRGDGTRIWANEVTTAVCDADDALVGYTKVNRDVTARRDAEVVAAQSRDDRARESLRRQLAAAEEDERRRLARELHDQLGQHLTAFALLVEETMRLVAGHADAQRRLEQLRELTGMMTRDARYLALELRPPELDDLGLESALETYVEQWRARYGIPVEVAFTGGGRPLPVEAATAIYRIVQEALTNVARHAGAQHVAVLLDTGDDEVRLLVEDDGRGFDVDATRARLRRERRLGLAGMRERASLMGGTLEVESSPGAGSSVYVRLPAAPA